MSNLLNLTMDQGSTQVFVFTIKDEASAAVNLTGYDFRLQVRRSYGDTSTLVNCTLANGKLAITNAVGGVVTLTFAPGDTSAIRFNSVNDDTLECVYDLEMVTPAGKVAKPARGTLTLNREVTR